jgi:hypothetical protein
MKLHFFIRHSFHNFYVFFLYKTHFRPASFNKFKYLGSILEATGETTLEIEKGMSEGRRVIGMLNSVLWSKAILHKTKKTHVPGFSPNYFTIWGRNMVTKHTTGEQITGN